MELNFFGGEGRTGDEKTGEKAVIMGRKWKHKEGGTITNKGSGRGLDSTVLPFRPKLKGVVNGKFNTL